MHSAMNLKPGFYWVVASRKPTGEAEWEPAQFDGKVWYFLGLDEWVDPHNIMGEVGPELVFPGASTDQDRRTEAGCKTVGAG